ncbi:hypothetical protein GCM10009733_008120 [Nonomuraea maheshkhaliensis]|uniref:Uncharacterized protein n=1 Tax=Nonomuraea maheshkhaliensis TaxID=419590 RepID=A0ABN2EQ23_9ACTN
MAAEEHQVVVLDEYEDGPAFDDLAGVDGIERRSFSGYDDPWQHNRLWRVAQP